MSRRAHLSTHAQIPRRGVALGVQLVIRRGTLEELGFRGDKRSGGVTCAGPTEEGQEVVNLLLAYTPQGLQDAFRGAPMPRNDGQR
jgi:hypothetical protein